MMEKLGIHAKMFRYENMKKYILEKCEFGKIYEKRSGELWTLAAWIVSAKIHEIIQKNYRERLQKLQEAIQERISDEVDLSMIIINKVYQKACEEAIPLLANELVELDYINAFLSSDPVRGEDRDELLKNIAKLIIED